MNPNDECLRLSTEFGTIQFGPVVFDPSSFSQLTTFKGGLDVDKINKMIERDGAEATALLIGELILTTVQDLKSYADTPTIIGGRNVENR